MTMLWTTSSTEQSSDAHVWGIRRVGVRASTILSQGRFIYKQPLRSRLDIHDDSDSSDQVWGQGAGATYHVAGGTPQDVTLEHNSGSHLLRVGVPRNSTKFDPVID